jgi:hypothetical protein
LIIDETGKRILPLPDLVKKIVSPRKKGSYIYNNQNFFNRLMIGDWLYFPSVAWTTEIIKKEKFSEKFHTAMDLEIFIRLMSKNYRIRHLDTCKFAYRRHEKSASSLYAADLGRFREELQCHRIARKLARDKKWYLGWLLAGIAITVRANKIKNYVKYFLIRSNK